MAQLTEERRAAALEKAAAARRRRVEIRERLKHDRTSTSLKDVLAAANKDEIVGKMKVSSVLESLPGVGKVRVAQIMQRPEIAPSRRLSGLGDGQRKTLLSEFGSE